MADSTVFIRVDNPEKKKLVSDVIKETGIVTSTGAVLSAAKQFLQQKKKIALLEKENTQLTSELNEAREILNRFYSNSNTLFEYGKKNFVKGKYPQKDLF